MKDYIMLNDILMILIFATVSGSVGFTLFVLMNKVSWLKSYSLIISVLSGIMIFNILSMIYIFLVEK